MTVLLIAEDDEDIRSVLERIFRRAGFSVLVATDGSHALRIAVEEQPDLILTDLDMPGLSGLELCRAVRAAPAISEVPIALISGSLLPDDPRAAEVQACGVILKPFSTRGLVAAVQHLVTGGRHRHHGTPSPCPLVTAGTP
jgi:CheY-like chemotaxis protein